MKEQDRYLKNAFLFNQYIIINSIIDDAFKDLHLIINYVEIFIYLLNNMYFII